MLKGVILDLDGVVADTHPAHLKAWRQLLASLGVDISDQHLSFILDGRKREDILRHFLGELTENQLLQYGHRKDLLFRQEVDRVGHIGGVPEFLVQVRDSGIAIALASCGARERVHFLLEKLALKAYFRTIVTAEDVPYGKPDPAIFSLAAKRLNIDRHEALVFEDAVAGVKAAKSAGMMCIGIGNSEHAHALREAGADDVVPDFFSVSVSRVARLVDDAEPIQRC